MVLSMAPALDLDTDSGLCLNFKFWSFLLLVTSTFMVPRRSRRLSFPLLASLELTCFGVASSCLVLTAPSCCVALPSTVFEIPGSTFCSATTLLSVWLFCSAKTEDSVASGCSFAFVVSSWSDEATLLFFSQNLIELVLRALPALSHANLQKSKSYSLQQLLWEQS